MSAASFKFAAAVACIALLLAGCGGGDADPAAACKPAEARAQLTSPVPTTAGLRPALSVSLRTNGETVTVSGDVLLAHAGVGVDRIVALRLLRDGAPITSLGYVAVPIGFRGTVSFVVTDPASPGSERAYALEVVDTKNGASAWVLAGSTLVASTGSCQ